MKTVTATNLRANLFEILDLVSEGEIVEIKRNNKVVARLVSHSIVSENESDWRQKLSSKMKILTPPDELIKPMDDVWEEYV